MNQVILDVETKRAFNEVGGYKPQALGVSFVGTVVRESQGQGKKQGYFETDLSKLWPVLEKADVIIGFNIIDFDLPVLTPYYPGKISQLSVLDLMARLETRVGHRVSLDALAAETLGIQKAGTGLDALEYFETGQLDKLSEYCLKDVEITRDIYDYGRTHGIVKFLNKWNRLIEAPVDFSFTPMKHQGTQMTLGGL